MTKTELIAALQKKVSGLTQLLDDQLGTPCEQIRHRQEMETLEAEYAKLRSALEAIAYMEIKSGSRAASVSMQRIAKNAIHTTPQKP